MAGANEPVNFCRKCYRELKGGHRHVGICPWCVLKAETSKPVKPAGYRWNRKVKPHAEPFRPD